jgi:hypothetical protein
MPLAPNNHTYLQLAAACYILLVVLACQKVCSDCFLLDEGSALLPVFHSPYQVELMKWMERYNTLHNQCGSSWDYTPFTSSYTFLEKNALKPSMYYPTRLPEAVLHVQFLGRDLLY